MKTNKTKHLTSKFICLFMLFTLLLTISSCSAGELKVESKNLMAEVESDVVWGNELDDKFIKAAANFSIELFKESVSYGRNSLVSPISVMQSLSFLGNGANNETRTQIELILGDNITIDEFNKYFYTIINDLNYSEEEKVFIGNSLWIKDSKNIKISETFLKTNAEYYYSDFYKSAFDETTAKDINKWIKVKSDNKIKSIYMSFDENTYMNLINTSTFDAEWQIPYKSNNIMENDFTSIDETTTKIEMLKSFEKKLLSDDNAKGFMKPYSSEKYSFIALMPNDDTSIESYINSLTGEKFLKIIENQSIGGIIVTFPKFDCESTLDLTNVLKNIGLTSIFSETADFSNLGNDEENNIYLSKVYSKSFLSVNKKGTKSGWVIEAGTMPSQFDMIDSSTLTIDKPFIYAIIDNNTNLPIFIGAVVNIDS